MEDGSGGGLIAWLDAMFGGAMTTAIAAVFGRLTWHFMQARNKLRPLFGIELLFELPTAVAMALVGDALSEYLALSHHVSIGVVAVLAYRGPRGAQVILDRWLSGKGTPK